MRLVRRREEWLLLLLPAVCLGLAWVFTKLSSELLEGELFAVDRTAQEWVSNHRSPALVTFFKAVTLLGAKEVLAPISALVGWWLFRGTKAFIALLVFSAIAAAEFVALLKRNFQIARPPQGLAAGLGFSFPSGHSTGAMAVAIVLSYASVRQRIHPRVVVPICGLFAILVGVSRVYLGVHWASDVIGGWLVGAAFGVGCCAVYELIHRQETARVALSDQPTTHRETREARE